MVEPKIDILIGNRLLLSMPEEKEIKEVKKGSIYIPTAHNDIKNKSLSESKVLAVGNGCSETIKESVIVGDTILYSLASTQKIYLDDIEYLLIEEDGIVATR